MNIYDIAEKAGVSIATVSRVMNGSDKVSEKTKQKILDIMHEADYTPNAFARGLTFNTMSTIGLLCANVSDPFWGTAVSYLEKGFRSKGYDCFLCCAGYDRSTRKEYVKLLLSKKVDAIVLVGSTFVGLKEENNQYLFDAAKEVPMILVNGYLDHPNFYCALCDDVEAVCNVTTNLINEGFKNTLFLYRADSYSGRHKRKGFINAFEKAGIEVKPEQILCMSDSITGLRDSLSKYYDETYKFDSVVAGDDELAIAAIKMAHQKGLKVPTEFSVIGYNNTNVGLCSEPEISTLDNRLELICSDAVGFVIDILDKKDVPKKTVISAEYIKRGSTTF